MFIFPPKQSLTPSSFTPGITTTLNPHVSYKSHSQRNSRTVNPLSFPPFLPPQAISLKKNHTFQPISPSARPSPCNPLTPPHTPFLLSIVKKPQFVVFCLATTCTTCLILMIVVNSSRDYLCIHNSYI